MESPPLSRFLHSLGKVQHHLHTIVVGLSAVEKGTATKPDNLDVTWTANDVIGSAREARRFLLKSTLIFVAEELQEYAIRILRYRCPSHSALPDSRVERIKALVKPTELDPSYLTVAPIIVSHWRNRIVHRDSRVRLTVEEKERLISRGDSIRDNYKGIDVARFLQDFEFDKPTLKDVTVLIAMCVKFVRYVDSSLPQPLTSREVRRWLEAEELLNDVLKLEKQATNGGDPNQRGRAKQYLITKAPVLAEAYYIHGVGVET
jgi:hypothetical protein